MAPKAEIKQDKKDKVKKLTDTLADAKSVVFVDYTGMDMPMQEGFRGALRETGAKMTIAKNTLIQIAGKKAGLPEESLTDTVLEGQTAIVIATDDAVAPIQALGKFVKANEMPKIKAGVVEGTFADEAGVVKITKLPTKEELSAQVVGAVAAPMYAAVGVLNANLQKLVYILDQARQSKSQQP